MTNLEKAIELYINGMSYMDAWKATGCGRNKLQQTLRERGLTRSNKQNSRIYSLNDDFFDLIDTEAKAYWLGFMYADGYVQTSKTGQKSIGVALSLKDIEHLERFKESLNSNYQVKTYKSKSFGTEIEYCRLWMTSDKLYDDIVSKGVKEHKTLTLTFPNESIVPKNLTNHFIRGYFDGDGSFSYTGKRDDTYAIKIEGTQSFLLSLAWELGYWVEPSSLHCRHKDRQTSFSLQFNAKDDVRKIGAYMYENATIYLERKCTRYRQV